MAILRPLVAMPVAWSKYSPNEAPQDPLAATSDEARTRIWVLRWGMWISQGMLYLGILLIFYWGIFRGSTAEAWLRDRWPF